MITETQYTQLKQYDRPLMTAYRAKYAHIAPNDLRHVLEIYYGPTWNKQVPKSVFSCGKCKLNELTKIGKDYYDYEQTTN